VEPGCNDMSEDLEPDQDVTVLRIKGVDPGGGSRAPG
jgi:hypothetical protein